MADPVPQDFAQRLGAVLQRTAGTLAPDIGAQLLTLISPQSLAAIATFFLAWVVGHAVGVGELIDVVVAVVGLFSVGLAVFSGLDELFEFGRTTYQAKTDADLDAAAEHLSQAIAILGVQTVLVLMVKGDSKSFPRAGRQPLGTQPPRTEGGLRYRPSTLATPTLVPESGRTSFYGDVQFSTRGRASEVEAVRLHEAFHQFLAPKFYLLRQFRVENRVHSYYQSSLYRYIEEAMASAFGHLKAYGFREAFEALSFPTQRGYVYVTRGGGRADESFGGQGIRPEGLSLVSAGLIQGFGFQVWYRPGNPVRADGAADGQDFMGRHADLFAAGLAAMP